jgi:hypothetical protein
MSESREADACPSCGADSTRVITAPNLLTMSSLKRQAAARNEKSRHEPHVCRGGCGAHRGAVKAPAPTGRTLYRYVGPRPWVVEHR